MSGKVSCEAPNAELYEYSGLLSVDGKDFSLKADQLLLKGSVLKNTDAVLGIVVYTGNDTRLMQNSKPGRQKMSKMEDKMNTLVIGILVVQLILCLIISCIGISWYEEEKDNHSYIIMAETTGENWVKSFFRYFLLLNTLIPISLIVTIEVVKVFQAYFMQVDVAMYNSER